MHTRSIKVITVTVILAVFLTSLALTSCAKDETTVKAEEHQQSAATFVDKREWSSAIEEYTAAIALNPKSDTAYEGRGNAYTEIGDYDLAIYDLSKAIELRPDRNGPYYGRGIAYRLRGDLDNAIADLSRAIGDMSRTRYRAALYERALAYKAAGKIDEARADLEKILQLEQEAPGEADKSWAEKAQQELAGLR